MEAEDGSQSSRRTLPMQTGRRGQSRLMWPRLCGIRGL